MFVCETQNYKVSKVKVFSFSDQLQVEIFQIFCHFNIQKMNKYFPFLSLPVHWRSEPEVFISRVFCWFCSVLRCFQNRTSWWFDFDPFFFFTNAFRPKERLRTRPRNFYSCFYCWDWRFHGDTCSQSAVFLFPCSRTGAERLSRVPSSLVFCYRDPERSSALLPPSVHWR